MTKDEIADNPKLTNILNKLRDGALQFRGAGDALNLPIEEKREDRGHNLANLASVQKAELHGTNYKERSEGTARIREPNGELEKWEAICKTDAADLLDLQRRQNEQYALGGAYSRALKLANAYLQKLPTKTKLIFQDRNVAKRKGETDADAMKRFASEISDAETLRKQALKAPRTAEDAKADGRKQILELAKKGTPDLTALLGPTGTVAKFPTYFVDFTPRADALPVLAWLHTDAMIAALEREIDAAASLESGALSTADKESKLQDLDSALYEAESNYESAWLSLASAGAFAPRRPKVADARPLLGLSRDMPKIKIELY